MDVQTTLLRIHEILEDHPGEDAAWMASVIDLYAKDETRFYQTLNSNIERQQL